MFFHFFVQRKLDDIVNKNLKPFAICCLKNIASRMRNTTSLVRLILQILSSYSEIKQIIFHKLLVVIWLRADGTQSRNLHKPYPAGALSAPPTTSVIHPRRPPTSPPYRIIGTSKPVPTSYTGIKPAPYHPPNYPPKPTALYLHHTLVGESHHHIIHPNQLHQTGGKNQA